MRIHKTSTEGRHDAASSKGKVDNSDRFSRMLEVRRKESMPRFDLPGENQSSVMAGGTQEPESISIAAAPADIQQLAAEIVDQILSHQANGVRSVEIHFNSQTLEALRVSLRSTEHGQVAINFVTPVAQVAGLLQKNLRYLRSALEGKGIRVTQIVVGRRAV